MTTQGGMPVEVTLSVVSHGQGSLVERLLADLRRNAWVQRCEIILTLNLPEDETYLAPYQGALPLRVVRNVRPRGFGANHNAAAAIARGACFAVLNPDLRVGEFDLQMLLRHLNNTDVGAVGPLVKTSQGQVEDSARRAPTVWRLFRRTVLKDRRLDYEVQRLPYDVDWLAGMFVLFPMSVFRALQGFDERFFMYFEDADIARRMRLIGRRVVLEPRVEVIHDAQRASHKDRQHFRWHLRSAVRYLWSI